MRGPRHSRVGTTSPAARQQQSQARGETNGSSKAGSMVCRCEWMPDSQAGVARKAFVCGDPFAISFYGKGGQVRIWDFVPLCVCLTTQSRKDFPMACARN